MIEKVIFGAEARESVMQGLQEAALAIIQTYGPAGRNIIYNIGGIEVRSTKDGVSVARQINFADKGKNQGAQLLRQACEETVDVSGDGTTLSALLAYNLVKSAEEHLKNGVNPNKLKVGIEKGIAQVIEQIKEKSIPCDTNEKIFNVATISGNNDPELGRIVAEAYEKIGIDGMVTLQRSKTGDTFVEHMTGMQIDAGFISPYFVNTEKFTVELKNVAVILCAQELMKLSGSIGKEGVPEKGILGILDKCVKEGLNVLIIAKDVDSEVISGLFTNKKVMASAAVRCPFHGIMQKELLEDIAAATGATVIDTEKGLDYSTMLWEHVGYAKSVTVGNKDTKIIGGGGNTEERVKILRSEYELRKDEVLKKRLARLAGGVSVINVGGLTDLEFSETLDRYDDSVKAVSTAIQGGIVEGGGCAMLNVEMYDDTQGEDERKGFMLVKGLLSAPIRQILKNAGIKERDKWWKFWVRNEISETIRNMKAWDEGFNALTMEYDEDMIESGIVDPAMVIVNALKNACSVASTVILTGGVILPKEN